MDTAASNSRIARLRALGPAAPRPHFGWQWPRTPLDGLRRALPLRRWKPAIAVCATLCAAMCLPLVAVGVPSFAGANGLMSFGIALFQSLWLLGWSLAAALPALALLALLLGQEVVVAEPGVLRLRIELLGLGIGADFPAAEVVKLQVAQGDAAQGTAWRGAHLVFDYHGIPVPFGSELEASAAAALCFDLQQVLARPAPAGFKLDDPAPPAPAQPAISAAPAQAQESAPASRLALLGLVLANLLPLIGVLLLDWKVGEIMLVYWAESVIIGLINIVKLVVIGRLAALFYAPFFLAHYGAFMTAHLMFVMMFFLHDPAHGGDLELGAVASSLRALWPALLGLSVSHLLSFAQNFIARGEYTRIKLGEQMNAPYRRVLVMQFTIIIGGMLTVALATPLPALLLLIALKLLVDVNAHRAERRRALPLLDDGP